MRSETSQQRGAVEPPNKFWKRPQQTPISAILHCDIIQANGNTGAVVFSSFSLLFILCRFEGRWDPGSRCLWKHKEPALLMSLIVELASKPAATVPLLSLLTNLHSTTYFYHPQLTWHHNAGVGWNVERMHPRWQPLTGFSDTILLSELRATLTCLSFSLLHQKALRPKWKWIHVEWEWWHWYEVMDVASGQTVNSWFVFRDI